MLEKKFLDNLKPEFIYVSGATIVPAKALKYKTDPETQKIIEVMRPGTHKFENILKADLKEELKKVDFLPTGKEVFMVITHGFHTIDEYKKCDLDNRAKTILDALKGPVYQDDSQVKILWTCKELLKDSEESYYSFVIKILDDSLALSVINGMRDLYRTV